MVIKKKSSRTKLTIDLTGSQGNAFCLMGYAQNYGKQLGLDYKKIIEEMKSSDYENLVKVFDKHFGSFITLLR